MTITLPTTITLKGMTWNHPRGYDPLVASSRRWFDETGVIVEWEKRSLQDFETFPVEELARAFDLIVIDHPHVGQITREKCLLPLDIPGRETERNALAAASIGQSYPSYTWQGRQWAFPIDAATQVQAWRADLHHSPPESWAEVLDLARAGKILIPLRPPHSLMSFYTLCGNLGHPCTVDRPGALVDLNTGIRVFDMLRELAGLVDPACFEMDPIAVLEQMALAEPPAIASPLIYGYVSYSVETFRDGLVRFCDIPSAGGKGPVGSALGGTGISVSAFSRHPDAAIDFAYWIASGDIQKTDYASAGGQPGHAAAWEDAKVNVASADFYRATRATLDAAWVRPRHNGYMAFQQSASDRLNGGLLSREPAKAVVSDINRLFEASFL